MTLRLYTCHFLTQLEYVCVNMYSMKVKGKKSLLLLFPSYLSLLLVPPWCSGSESEPSDHSCYCHTSHIPGTPGGAGSSNSNSRLIGGGMQAGKIGRQIADEVLDSQRRNDSASNSPVSPFEGILGSGASDRSFAALLRPPTDMTTHRVSVRVLGCLCYVQDYLWTVPSQLQVACNLCNM